MPSSRAHFPSLEEQKLADEAWNALGLELGPISEKDLRRVKVLGYDGGLRVANDGSSAAFRRSDVQTGDLLVGLHVWPTTSLKDVAKVLNRDDLAELIPLKFYVVRRAVTQMQPGFGGGEPRSRMAAESHDEVVTGRIGIDSPFLQARRGSATAQAVSTSHDLLQVPQSPEASDQLQGDFQAQRMALSQFQHQVESQIGEAVQRLRADRGRQGLVEQQLAKLQAEARADVPDGRKQQLATQMEQLRQQIASLHEEAEKQTQAIQQHAVELQQNVERLKRGVEQHSAKPTSRHETLNNMCVERKVPRRNSGRRSVASGRKSPMSSRPLAPPAPTPIVAPQMPGQPRSAPAAMPAPNAPFAPSAMPAPFAPETRISPRSLAASDAAPTPYSQGPTTSQLPYVVRIEQGASRFSDGDNITVLEVRGTAETLMPGNFYWIKGTYSLGSHDRARLAVNITAKDRANETALTWKTKDTVVNRGSGTFELYLPMSYGGWPHVSFYPADGGQSFGSTYFGTGGSVLKKWRGPNGVKDRTLTNADIESGDVQSERTSTEASYTGSADGFESAQAGQCSRRLIRRGAGAAAEGSIHGRPCGQ